jgi:uncharacterized membrane protein YvbJ
MFCEHCGAELETDARFCSMCGSQAGEAEAGSAGQQFPQGVPNRHIRILQKGLIAALLVVLVLGRTLFWMVGSEKVDERSVATDPKVLMRANAAKLIEQRRK